MTLDQAETLLRAVEEWSERMAAEAHALVILIRQAMPSEEDEPS